MLPILPLHFELQQHENLHLPEHAGSMLRGAFGHSLKKLTCITKLAECKDCPLSQMCVYTQVFETPSEPNKQQIVNPYVIQAPSSQYRMIAHHTVWQFGMTLVGKAINQLPIIAYAWQKTCEEGFSKDKSQAELIAIYHHDQIVYQPSKPLATHTPSPVQAKPLESVVHLDFVSPLRIQHNNYIVLNPEELTASIVLITLAKRVQRLAELHATPIHLDITQLLAAAQQISISTHLKRSTMTRYSNRQQRLMNLDGLIGRISLTGDLSLFSELLSLGELVHIGKNATMGLGQYKITLV